MTSTQPQRLGNTERVTLIVLAGMVVLLGVGGVVAWRIAEKSEQEAARFEAGVAALAAKAERAEEERKRAEYQRKEAEHRAKIEASAIARKAAWEAYAAALRSSGYWGSLVLDCQPTESAPGEMRVMVSESWANLNEENRDTLLGSLRSIWDDHCLPGESPKVVAVNRKMRTVGVSTTSAVWTRDYE